MMRPPYRLRRRMSADMAGVAMMASLPTTTLDTPLPAASFRMTCTSPAGRRTAQETWNTAADARAMVVRVARDGTH